MKINILHFGVVFLTLLLFSCSTQKDKKAPEEESVPDFGSMEMLGDNGTEGYRLSYQTTADIEPFREELLKNFGEPDSTKGRHEFTWNKIEKDSLYAKPFNLVINTSEISNSDGSPSGEYWITIATPGNEMLLEPGTESYSQFKSYFDEMRKQTLSKK